MVWGVICREGLHQVGGWRYQCSGNWKQFYCLAWPQILRYLILTYMQAGCHPGIRYNCHSNWKSLHDEVDKDYWQINMHGATTKDSKDDAVSVVCHCPLVDKSSDCRLNGIISVIKYPIKSNHHHRNCVGHFNQLYYIWTLRQQTFRSRYTGFKADMPINNSVVNIQIYSRQNHNL